MKKILNISLLVAIFTLTGISLSAQKFGYLDSGEILAEMPGVIDSDNALKAYQDSLVTVGEEKAAQLQKDIQAYSVEYGEGNIPPVKAREKEAEFQKRDQELMQYNQVIYNLVNKRRQELVAPFIEKLQTAIDKVGKEGGYTFIFESGPSVTGLSALLIRPDGDDISAQVRAELGIE